jgi:4'-phosphopantetheinyl transferase EntD
VIEKMLPAFVACVSVFGDLSPETEGGLFPAEAAAISKAVPKRRAEFTTVRMCARRVLRELGLPAVSLAPGKRGAVIWPPGVGGSMTHCDGFRAAAACRTEDCVSLGIDAEPNQPLPEGVLQLVSRGREARQVASLTARDPAICWDRLLFSAKESVFKAWYPLTGRELDFDEAELDIDPDLGTFTARLLVPGPEVAGRRLDVFPGRWLAQHGFVTTAIVLPGDRQIRAAGGGRLQDLVPLGDRLGALPLVTGRP